MKVKKYFIVFVALLLMIIGFNGVGAYSSNLYLNLNESIQMSILITEESNFMLEEDSLSESLLVVENGVLRIDYENNYLGSYDLKNKVLVLSIYKERLDVEDSQNEIYIKYSWYSPNDYLNSSDGINQILNYYDSNVGYFSTLVFNGYSQNDPISYNYFIMNYRDFRILDVLAINRDSLTFISDEIKYFGVDDYDSVYQNGYDNGYDVGYDEGVVSVTLGGDVSDFGSFGRIMLDMVDNFLGFEIVPNFSLLNVLQLVMTICLAILFLKFFAGG